VTHAQRGGLPGLIDALNAVHARAERSVLGIVFATSGSTYRKPGAMVLLDAKGLRFGVISGGCLEPELEERARDVLHSGRAAIADFDMRTDEDITFGTGTGCQGRVRLLLLPQHADAPLAQALLMFAGTDKALSLTLACDGENIGAGHAALGAMNWQWSCDGNEVATPPTNGIALRVEAPPRVLLLGAGAETIALQEFVRRLGWRSVCVEHRGRWLGFAQRAGVDEIIEQPPHAAADIWRMHRIDAAVAMSHNYSMDAANLGLLAASDVGYIGLLGPVSRRDRLLGEIGAEAAERVRERLHAPVGLPLGGSGPEMLALSIAAELQRYFADRTC
jgi:xanthine dehydrogenase accessory factor